MRRLATRRALIDRIHRSCGVPLLQCRITSLMQGLGSKGVRLSLDRLQIPPWLLLTQMEKVAIDGRRSCKRERGQGLD